MSEILYAQKLEISDDRIKTASVAEVSFTTQAYAESAAFFSKDTGAQIAATRISMDDAVKLQSITPEQRDTSTSSLNEMTAVEYAVRQNESTALKTGGATEDLKAVGEILEEVSTLRREDLAESKYYALNYLDHIVRAVKMRLVVRDQSVSKEREKKLDQITQAVSALNEAFITKYANTKTFADRMLSISGSAEAKKLGAPVVQAANFKYEGL